MFLANRLFSNWVRYSFDWINSMTLDIDRSSNCQTNKNRSNMALEYYPIWCNMNVKNNVVFTTVSRLMILTEGHAVSFSRSNYCNLTLTKFDLALDSFQARSLLFAIRRNILIIDWLSQDWDIEKTSKQDFSPFLMNIRCEYAFLLSPSFSRTSANAYPGRVRMIVFRFNWFSKKISIHTCQCQCIDSKQCLHSRRSVDSSMSEYYHQCLISTRIVRQFFFFLLVYLFLFVFVSLCLVISISSEYRRIY